MNSSIFPQWLYFDYYLLCKRQRKFPGNNLSPSLLAWNSIGAGIAIPLVTFAFMIDHYVHFAYQLGQVWLAFHLPGGQKASDYALTLVVFVTGIIILNVIFRGKHGRIMDEFHIYDKSTMDLVPSLIFSVIWIAMSGVSVFGFVFQWSGTKSSLLVSVIINFCIFITTEIVFRIWWHRWQLKKRLHA